MIGSARERSVDTREVLDFSILQYPRSDLVYQTKTNKLDGAPKQSRINSRQVCNCSCHICICAHVRIMKGGPFRLVVLFQQYTVSRWMMMLGLCVVVVTDIAFVIPGIIVLFFTTLVCDTIINNAWSSTMLYEYCTQPCFIVVLYRTLYQNNSGNTCAATGGGLCYRVVNFGHQTELARSISSNTSTDSEGT